MSVKNMNEFKVAWFFSMIIYQKMTQDILHIVKYDIENSFELVPFDSFINISSNSKT